MTESQSNCCVVSLHLSFVRGLFSAASGGVIRSSVQAVWKNFDENCELLSVGMLDKISKFDIQWSTNIVATAAAVFLGIGIVFDNFEYRSGITTIN